MTKNVTENSMIKWMLNLMHYITLFGAHTKPGMPGKPGKFLPFLTIFTKSQGKPGIVRIFYSFHQGQGEQTIYSTHQFICYLHGFCKVVVPFVVNKFKLYHVASCYSKYI